MALLNKLFSPLAPTSASLSSPGIAAAAAGSSNSASTPTLSTLATAKSAWTLGNSASSSGTAAAGKRQAGNQSVHSKNYLSHFPFDGRQVRVLLYLECDSRGRRLLFDSKALQKVVFKETGGNSKGDKVTRGEEKTSVGTFHLHNRETHVFNKQTKSTHSNDFIEVCEEFGYKHNRPNSTDITSIGEMVFGALAMSFRGTALKVHWLQEPARILCSQVFLTPTPSAASSHSPYSTLSLNSLATPRTSISSEQGSIDGFSMSSIPYSISVGRQMSLTPSDRSSMMTCPLDVPDQQSISTNSDGGLRYSSTYSTATDSGYSGASRSQLSSDQWSASYQYSARSSLGSVTSEQLDPLRKLSVDSAIFPTSSLFEGLPSDGNLQRRICRNLRTSFENENSVNDFIGFISDRYSMAINATNCGGSEGGAIGVPNYRRASYSANESRSNPEIGKRRDAAGASVIKSMRRAKLGLAVCITMSESFEEEMELFCSEHIALLEAMLGRLRACSEHAYVNRRDLLQTMYHAWHDTQQWFNDLFTAPRIKCPVWLSITTSGSKYSKNVAEQFVKELCWLISQADTKDTNFFISTMLTAILTHHLGWVSTVSAFNSTSSRTESSEAAIEQRAKLLQISQKHPYNALWAQMGDLYGAIGMPPKLTRTVIYGTEKLAVGRLLNILTYFIRCGEVRRSAKREDFNKELINTIVCQKNNETLKKSSTSRPYMLKKTPSAGLTRTQTCKQNLNTISDSYDVSSGSGSGEEADEVELVQTLKKNEIPNVLAFRDSRFVQQELRIGNYLMDTGIEKNSLPQNKAKHQSTSTTSTKDGRIRLTVTTPENVETNVAEDDSNCSSAEDGAVEATEYYSNDNTIDDSAKPNISGKKNFLWNIVPAVKEGLSLNDLEKVQNGVRLINRKLDRRSSSFCSVQSTKNIDHENRMEKGLSLSDLITQNSMGKSDRMTWGIEPIKENVSLEEQIHFDQCQKQIEREHGICRNSKIMENESNDSVVFVLGDNEPLVNIKKSTEDISLELHGGQKQDSKQESCQTLCPMHQRTHGPTLSKKHSGVKFNFEQYPQIATNYMKSKNLLMTNYDLLMDKCSKFETHEDNLNAAFPTTSYDIPGLSTQGSSECVVCNSILNSYQTPSNATELEFETDDVHCYSSSSTTTTNSVANERTLHTVGSTASVVTLKSANNNDVQLTPPVPKQPESDELIGQKSATPVRKPTYSGNNRKISSHRGSTSSVAAKCAAVNEAAHLLKLPIPGIKEIQEDEPPGDMKLRAGFIPSLFLTVNDHYISDMVLQGTCASPNKWEMRLREDLALAAHSASLISLPAENIAIVADMEKWDVRLISSQTQCFTTFAGGQSSPVGMSQLVSSMLETVYAMHSSGIAAYECLSFLECKMQEIYLQSETLAAFLLETEFCALNAVTTALNLSENDVPLLLSIASIHTPQISKKCGISFR